MFKNSDLHQRIQNEVLFMAKKLGIIDKLHKEQQVSKTSDLTEPHLLLKRHNVLAAFVAWNEKNNQITCLSIGLGTKCLSQADLLKAQVSDYQRESKEGDNKDSNTACTDTSSREKRRKVSESRHSVEQRMYVPFSDCTYRKIHVDDLVVDMHAEVLAKRALTHLILSMQNNKIPLISGIFEWKEDTADKQIDRKTMLNTDERHDATCETTEDGKHDATCGTACETYPVSNDKAISVSSNQRHIALCSNVKLFLYSSRMPCGFLSIPQLLTNIDKYNDSRTNPETKQQTDSCQHPLITVDKNGLLCIRGHSSLEHPLAYSLPRTKPGRLDAPIAYSMSCSDKLLKWQRTGQISSKWLPHFKVSFQLLVPLVSGQMNQRCLGETKQIGNGTQCTEKVGKETQCTEGICTRKKQDRIACTETENDEQPITLTEFLCDDPLNTYPWISYLNKTNDIPNCLIEHQNDFSNDMKASSICAVWACSNGMDTRSVEYLCLGRRVGACRDGKTKQYPIKSRSFVSPWSFQQLTSNNG